MADLYELHPLPGYSSSAATLESLPLPANYPMASADHSHLLPAFEPKQVSSAVEIETAGANSEEESSGVIRAKIASHPLYPNLVHAFVNCLKVGTPSEFANIIDQNNRGSGIAEEISSVSTCLGFDPKLDEFMVTYCGILAKCELDLFQPFMEASSFINDMETQLNMVCVDGACTTRGHVSDESASEEDISGEEVELADSDLVPGNENGKLKERLLRKYGGQVISLKQEISKTKRIEHLPKEAKRILISWWNIHSHWPYPTDTDKVELCESTGLNHKQLNNWFINQRKRHWKLTVENMHLS